MLLERRSRQRQQPKSLRQRSRHSNEGCAGEVGRCEADRPSGVTVAAELGTSAAVGPVLAHASPLPARSSTASADEIRKITLNLRRMGGKRPAKPASLRRALKFHPRGRSRGRRDRSGARQAGCRRCRGHRRRQRGQLPWSRSTCRFGPCGQLSLRGRPRSLPGQPGFHGLRNRGRPKVRRGRTRRSSGGPGPRRFPSASGVRRATCPGA